MEDGMPRISAEREEATRQRILKAAMRVFIEKGFHRASIDDVVAACGLSVGAIYNYFPNKDELIRASIDDSGREETEALLADTQAVGSIWDRMERAMGGWWRGTVEIPGGPAFLADAWGEASRRPLIRDLMARRFERSVMFSTVILRESVNRGELPAELDVDGLARMFAALLDGMVLEYVHSGGSLRLVDAVNRVRLVMGAVQGHAGE
jgi:AcrR family transcriptional regulator